MRTIEVVTYDENWMSLYIEEAEKLRDVLKEELIDIHHIGSTSGHDTCLRQLEGRTGQEVLL